MIHEPSKERILSGPGGEHILGIFEALALDVKEMGNGAGHLIVSFLGGDDDFKAGSLVPELHFVLREVEDDVEAV